MPFLNDRVLDNGLSVLDTEADELHICSQEPTTYAEAVTTYSLGNKAAPTVGAPADGSPNGRAVTVSAISDGTVTANGTATHWALVDSVNSRLLAAESLASGVAVTTGAGETFSLGSFTIRKPDPA